MRRNDSIGIGHENIGEMIQGSRGLALRIALIPLVLICSFIFVCPSHLASAHALAGNGRITGQLLDGTKNNAPIAGQTVTLQAAQGDNAQDLTTAATDVHGSYTFANLSTDKTISYAVYIRYQGAQYVSDVISLDSKPVQQLNLTVYEATTSTAKIAITQANILVHEPDAHRGSITVSEIFAFRNLDSHTYVGSFNTSKGKPNALRFSLPGNARAISLGSGFDGYSTVQVDLGFATNAALPPGTSQFSFSFQIPYSASTYDFSYTSVYPTVQFSFMVPTDISANSGILTSGGVITAADQHSYQVFNATGLLVNDSVHVELEGLPKPTSTGSPTPLNTGNIWFLAAALFLLAITVIAWYLYRSNFRRVTRRRQGKLASETSKTSKNAKERFSATSSGPENRKEALLQELLALDKSFESGKLSKAVYQERRTKTKARLRSLLREQEASHR